jgi:hypothetical protein
MSDPAGVSPRFTSVTSFASESVLRRILLVQAFESAHADHPQWTAEDRVWATRLAREGAAAAAQPIAFLDERARHAMQRLGPREPAVRQALARRGWRSGWLLIALAVGLVAGAAADAIGSSQRINLLAPPVWALVLWNLLVYIALVLPLPGRVRLWLSQRLLGFSTAGSAVGSPLARFRVLWLRHAAPLLAARAALLMHAAAAALSIGLMSGMYVRGLVLDYRAAWQSTFLDAAQVHAALGMLLAPAVGLTGIALPDLAALQALRAGAQAAPVPVPGASANGQPASAVAGDASGPISVADRGSAAPWIHLYAATLLLFVVLPRGVLALVAAMRAGYQQRRLPLPLDGPYFQRLLREHQGQAGRVQVLPHGQPPSPYALACLQAVLAAALGSGLRVSSTAATAYGDEEAASLLQAQADTTLRLALVDLAATPEDDTHGAFVRALRSAAPGLPLLVLADESAFRVRFAALPTRLAERRTAWQQWAKAAGVGLVCLDLAQPDAAAAERDLQLALGVDGGA